jgi:hypothetical protein
VGFSLEFESPELVPLQTTEKLSVLQKMYIINYSKISEKAETENKEGNGQTESGPNENADESLKLAEASLDLGQNGKNRQLDIKCDQGKSGQKTIEISMPIVRINILFY